MKGGGEEYEMGRGRASSRVEVISSGNGVWYMVYGMWYMVYGIWYVVCGIWYNRVTRGEGEA